MKNLKVERRTLTIQGTETSIVLEQAFWDVIDWMAKLSARSWRAVVLEIVDRQQPGSDLSRAAWLRVWCVQKLKSMLQRHVDQSLDK